jgi:hypothetical protein
LGVEPIDAFYADALEANRRGALTDTQRKNFRAEASSDRRIALGLAAVFLAIAVLVGVFASAKAPVVTREVITGVSLLAFVFIVVRAVLGLDALTRDVRAGHVQSAEGAIGKRGSVAPGRNTSNKKIVQVGNQRFQVGSTRYQQLPDAGHVRYYYLPRSRMFVNFEQLENRFVPEPTVQSITDSFGALARAHGAQARDEVRARMADSLDKIGVGFTGSPGHAVQPGDAATAERLVGTWSNAMMSVTFRKDGTVSAQLGGRERAGNWSVDAAGRLSSNITGEHQTADASISGNQLTIAIGGRGFRFTRHE